LVGLSVLAVALSQKYQNNGIIIIMHFIFRRFLETQIHHTSSTKQQQQYLSKKLIQLKG